MLDAVVRNVGRALAALSGDLSPARIVGAPRPPDFFCIGSEKAGTTWLWSCMMAHPNIGVPIVKEMRHFNLLPRYDAKHFRTFYALLNDPRSAPNGPAHLERLSNELRVLYGGRHGYLRVFGGMSAEVVGDITPQYCIQPTFRVREMKRVAPDAKIIYMLRDPVQRALSGGKMTAKRDLAPAAFTDEKIYTYATRMRQIDFCRAHRHLAKYENVFGSDNVGVFFFDDISTRPQALLDDVARFLGVEPAGIPKKFLTERVNEGVAYAPGKDLEKKLYARLKPIYRALEQRFPERVQHWRQAYES